MKNHTTTPQPCARKWSVDELRHDWGQCHRVTIYRLLSKHGAKVLRIGGRILLPDDEKTRIEAALTDELQPTGGQCDG